MLILVQHGRLIMGRRLYGMNIVGHPRFARFLNGLKAIAIFNRNPSHVTYPFLKLKIFSSPPTYNCTHGNNDDVVGNCLIWQYGGVLQFISIYQSFILTHVCALFTPTEAIFLPLALLPFHLSANNSFSTTNDLSKISLSS